RGDGLSQLIETVRRKKEGERLTQNILRLVAVEACGAAVPTDHGALQCHADNGIVGGFDDRSQQVMSAFRLFTFHAGGFFVESSLDSQGKAPIAVLENVVRGAFLHALHGGFLTHGTRYQDERNILPLPLQGLESVDSRPVGQGVVRQDYIVGGGTQGCYEVIGAYDNVDVQQESRALQ